MNYDYCNAGNGYIYSDNGLLFSLADNSSERISGTKPDCIVKNDGRIVYSDDWIIEYSGKFYESKNNIQALFFYKNDVAFLDNNLNLKIIKLSDFKNYGNEFFNNQSNKSRNENVNVNSNGYITGIDCGTTVKDLKNYFSDSVIIYDHNGNEITSDKIKTGYRAVVSDVIYEISVSGDITGEGNVKSNDVSALMSYFVNKSDLKGVYLASADFNNDENIDNKDLVSIAKKAEN